jgi:hypothetical protein
MRRRGSRPEPEAAHSLWIVVGCCGDGYSHRVTADLASGDLARVGRVIAQCGHMVTAASLTDAPRPPCALCFSAATDVWPRGA